MNDATDSLINRTAMELVGDLQMIPESEAYERCKKAINTSVESATAALRQEVELLRMDKQMLDWLERRSHDEIKEIQWLNNIRSAITAAMKLESKP